MKTFGIVSTLILLAFGIASSPAKAQVEVDSERHGTCISADEDHRTRCFFPSDEGFYNNVQAIEITGGSGADVVWRYYRRTNRSQSAGFTVDIITIGAGSSAEYYEEARSQRCTIGFTQYNQNPRCQNPYRGAATGFVQIQVLPHNHSWQTDFKLIPD